MAEVEEISPIFIHGVKLGVFNIELKFMVGMVANIPKELLIIDFLLFMRVANFIFDEAKVFSWLVVLHTIVWITY